MIIINNKDTKGMGLATNPDTNLFPYPSTHKLIIREKAIPI